MFVRFACLLILQPLRVVQFLNVDVTAAMTSPAYQCYAGAPLPIAGQEVGLQEVELCI